MKQSEKYELLIFALCSFLKDHYLNLPIPIDDDDIFYVFDIEFTGAEYHEMLKKLGQFRDKARKKEKKRGGQIGRCGLVYCLRPLP